MINKFKSIIKTFNLIEKNDRILIGLSGGADSICLLHLLTEIKSEYNIEIYAAHLNHGVRGKEAERDEEFSKNVSENLGIGFVSEKADMNGYAKKEKLSKEAAGRVLRRNFLKKSMELFNCNKLALAHNLDDQVETILMRILRGTGTDGLKGIEIETDYIIRPLLEISRIEIESYLAEKDILYVDDSTNFENDYHRNKIRNLLIPEIKSEYNVNLESALLNLSKIAKEDTDFLEKFSAEKYNEIIIKKANFIELDIESFEELDLSIQRRIVRSVIKEMNGSLEDISFDNISEIIGLCLKGSGKKINNIRGLCIRNSYGKLVFENLEKSTNLGYYISLELGNNIVNDEYSIVFEYVDRIEEKSDMTIYFPAEVVRGNLIARNRRAGDKIMLLGLNGTKKVKDVFIDKKIDRKLRDLIPIIEDEDKILWVSGLAKSEESNLRSQNDRYIKLTLLVKNMEENDA